MTPTDGVLASSFRDPCGFVYRRDGVLYRQVNAAGLDDYEQLMSSGLAKELVALGALIAHEEKTLDLAVDDRAAKVLEPQPIPFISHPYEWCFSQLRVAALLTLKIQRAALRHGMILKDASAYNIQFAGGRPVLIDTLSFTRHNDGDPWSAYRQFCQHFLAPLALMALTDVRLGLMLRTHLDGVPLDLACRLLPWHSRLRPGLLMHLHLHARSQDRYADNPDQAQTRIRKGMSPQAHVGLIDSLEGAVRGLRWKPGRSAWRDYYEEVNYSDDAVDKKSELVSSFLTSCSPGLVWDLGANTGRFAKLASELGHTTVAWDLDPAAVESAFQNLDTQNDGELLPLVIDLTNPSPALGWNHSERDAFADRGPASIVLALALIHHLAIANNVPLSQLADYFAGITHDLVIEFVPKSDSQVRRLLASREDIFHDYHEQGFEAAFAPRFEILRRDQVSGSDRILYLMRRRNV
jgi:hypothetical protein